MGLLIFSRERAGLIFDLQYERKRNLQLEKTLIENDIDVPPKSPKGHLWSQGFFWIKPKRIR